MASPLSLARSSSGGEQPEGNPPSDQGAPSWESDFRWIVAWLVLLLIIAAIAQTRIGKVVIYYVLALSLLFLIVTQFRFIAGALAPFSELGPGLGPQADNDTPTPKQGG